MPAQKGTDILLHLLCLPGLQAAGQRRPHLHKPVLLPGAARSERLWSNLATLLPRTGDLFNVTSKPGTGSEWQVQCYIY